MAWGTDPLAKGTFEYFPYAVENMEELTLSVVESLNPSAQDWEVIQELNLLEVNSEVLYRSFSTLSNGDRICLSGKNGFDLG